MVKNHWIAFLSVDIPLVISLSSEEFLSIHYAHTFRMRHTRLTKIDIMIAAYKLLFRPDIIVKI